MARATEFEQFIADEVEKNRGAMVPVKASLAERMFVKKARWQQVHPNPDDEFCFPSIGQITAFSRTTPTNTRIMA